MKFSALISVTAILSLATASPLASATTDDAALKVHEYTGTNATLGKRQSRFGTVQFFSGNACDRPNGVGGVININDQDIRCVDAGGRHSIDVRGCKANIGFYERAGCQGKEYSLSTFNPNNCYNINTGKGWGSSRVWCNFF